MGELYTEFGLSPPLGISQDARARGAAFPSPPPARAYGGGGASPEYISAVDAEIGRRDGIRADLGAQFAVPSLSFSPLGSEALPNARPSHLRQSPSPRARPSSSQPSYLAPTASYAQRVGERRSPATQSAARPSQELAAPGQGNAILAGTVHDVLADNRDLRAKNEKLLSELKKFRGHMGGVFRKVQRDSSEAVEEAVSNASVSRDATIAHLRATQAELQAALAAMSSQAARASDVTASTLARAQSEAAALEQQKHELLKRITEQSALLVELTQQSRLMKDDVDASGGRWAQEMQLLRDELLAKTSETEVLRNALDNAVGDARAQSAAPATLPPAPAAAPAALVARVVPAAPSIRVSRHGSIAVERAPLGFAAQPQQSTDVAALSRLETTAAVARAVEGARADAAAATAAAVERARADAATTTAAAVARAVERTRGDAREALSGLHAIASAAPTQRK